MTPPKAVCPKCGLSVPTVTQGGLCVCAPTEVSSGMRERVGCEIRCWRVGGPAEYVNGVCNECGSPRPATTVTSDVMEATEEEVNAILRENGLDPEEVGKAGQAFVNGYRAGLGDRDAAITTAEQRGRDGERERWRDMVDSISIDKGGKTLCPYWTEWEREKICALIAALRTKDTQ